MSQDDDGRTRRRFLSATAALGVATSLAGCTGELTGEVDDDDSDDESDTETPEPTATEDDGFAFGSTEEFVLEEDDGPGPEGDTAKPVRFQGSSGDEVTITMTAEFDTLLILEGPDGDIVAENDDAIGMGLNSQISTTLSQSGEYTIWCGSFFGDSTGEFTLSLERGLASETEDEPESEIVDPGEIDFGEEREFTLDAGDGTAPDGDLAKPVQFQASSGDEATITMTAEFDTLLILEGPDGDVVARNDDIDFGENLDSRISMTLPDSGEYTIWCGSFLGSSEGPFTLSLERGLYRESGSETVDAESIEFGETLNLALEEGDGRDPERSSLARPVTFEGSAGDEVTITQRSDTFDTYLVLEGPDGSVVAQNDDIDYGQNLDSRISTTLPDSGEYTIWCGSFLGSSEGSYTLSLERGLTDGGESTV